MKVNRLYLVGAVHSDSDGRRRLEGLLKQISPDVITIELHEESDALAFQKEEISPQKRKRLIEKYCAKAGLKLTNVQINLLKDIEIQNEIVKGYEFHVSREYQRANQESRIEYIAAKKEFIKPENVDKLIVDSLRHPQTRKTFLAMLGQGKDRYFAMSRKSTEMLYNAAKLFWDVVHLTGVNPMSHEPAKGELSSEADNYFREINEMADKIRRIYDDGSKRVLSIMELNNVSVMISKVSDLKPVTMTLADYKGEKP